MAMQEVPKEVPKKVHVHPINVGQGDAILLVVELNNGAIKRYLIDGGPGHLNAKTLHGVVTPFNNLIKALSRNGCIQERNRQWIMRLNSIINTHPDADHHGGINALLGIKKINVSCPIITTDAASVCVTDEISGNESTYTYRQYYSNADDCPHFWLQPNGNQAYGWVLGDVHQQSTVRIEKDSDFISEKDCNATSILTTVKLPESNYDYDVVLTGDSYGGIILRTLGLESEEDTRKTIRIFQVPHHGSKENSTMASKKCGGSFQKSSEFYEQFDADLYLISHGLRYDHPHSEVITGILSAAVQKGKNNSTDDSTDNSTDDSTDDSRFCRIVVTATWFIESKINYFYRKRIRDWRKFVKIYYFNEGTPFVTLADLDWSRHLPEGLREYTPREEKKQMEQKQMEGTDKVRCKSCYKECDRCAKNDLCAKCLTCIICKEFCNETRMFTAVCNRCGSRAHANAETTCTRYNRACSYYCIECRKCTKCNEETDTSKAIKCSICEAPAHVSCVQGTSTSASKYTCCECDLIILDLAKQRSETSHQGKVINGNCFFKSMVINIKTTPDTWQNLGKALVNNEESIIIQYLRRVLVCELLGVRRQLYERQLYENLAPENYEEEVKKFLSPTFFDSPIGDFMPAALAKALDCSIVISFKDSNHKWTIRPTEGGTIPTAYLIYDRYGSGHYDV